jgi:hypothetical protein
MSDRELIEELSRGGVSWPVLGRGQAPDGTWELRAVFDAPDGAPGDGELYLQIEFQTPDGTRAGGSGFGGVELADSQRPLVVSMSGRGTRPSIC